MAKMIEIKGRTVAVLIAILIGFSALIFFLNSYDQTKKSALLKKNLELLDKSPVVKRIEERLISNDSLPHNVVKEIMSELSILKEETQNIYFYNPQVIIERDKKYLTISSRNHNYTKEEFKPINGETEAILKELQKTDADVFSVLNKENKKNHRKKIVFPLTENKQRQSFLFIEYLEER